MIAKQQEPGAELFSEFALQWFHLLAESRFAEAVALLDKPNCYGVIWNEYEIKRCLGEYSAGACVSDPATASGKRDTNLGQFNDSSGYWFDHSVPLNGTWSDLTAQFEFIKCDEGLSVSLHDIHVL